VATRAPLFISVIGDVFRHNNPLVFRGPRTARRDFASPFHFVKSCGVQRFQLVIMQVPDGGEKVF
jgi:hypothetical protein